VGRHSSSEV